MPDFMVQARARHNQVIAGVCTGAEWGRISGNLPPHIRGKAARDVDLLPGPRVDMERAGP